MVIVCSPVWCDVQAWSQSARRSLCDSGSSQASWDSSLHQLALLPRADIHLSTRHSRHSVQLRLSIYTVLNIEQESMQPSRRQSMQCCHLTNCYKTSHKFSATKGVAPRGTWVNVPPSWIERNLAPELQTDDCFAIGDGIALVKPKENVQFQRWFFENFLGTQTSRPFTFNLLTLGLHYIYVLTRDSCTTLAQAEWRAVGLN